ncbi:chondroitinase family protein [Photobacterium sanctipauli]|uniref:chondroitinase family protein n=1 Tax=Photobacterium sanctipauli TaxID=1342794 RepID=UPI000A827319|nr:chondroitinase family protein [Photobacterium sanctipauli]
MKYGILTLSIMLALTGCNSNQNNEEGKANEPGGYMYFFEDGIPQTISTNSPHALAISNQQSKDGDHSLQWQFESTNTLKFSNDIGYSADEDPATPLTFMAWVYNSTPINDSLRFSFKTNEQENVFFQYSLNFTGWRGIAVPFRDMNGAPAESMNQLKLLLLALPVPFY